MQPVVIRQADPDRDYGVYAEIVNSCEPRVITPELLREQDLEVSDGTFLNRFVAERDGKPVAVGSAYRIIWDPPATGRVVVWVSSESRKTGVGSLLADHVEAVAVSYDLNRLETTTWEDDSDSRRFVEKRGFKLRARCFESTIDLREFDPKQFEHWTFPEGVDFFALSERRMDEADQRKLWDLNSETSCDEPSNDSEHRPTFEQFCDGVIKASWFDPSLQIVAAVGEEWIGMSAVGEVSEGGHENLFTAVRRNHRGRGIAKALKLIALTRAKAAGATIVRTDNDSRNAPMLAINEALGYVSQPGFLKWSKAA